MPWTACRLARDPQPVQAPPPTPKFSNVNGDAKPVQVNAILAAGAELPFEVVAAKLDLPELQVPRAGVGGSLGAWGRGHSEIVIVCRAHRYG